MEKQIRKYQSTLRCVGKAIIIFGVWDLIKLILSIITGYYNMIINAAYENNTAEAEVTRGYIWIMFLTIFIIFALIMLMRIYIGRTAIAIGVGKKEKGWLYIVLTMLMILFYVLTIISGINSFSSSTYLINAVITYLIDASSIVLMTDMIYSSFRLFALKKKLRREQ